MAAGLAVRPGDSVLLSIADRDKAESVQMMRDLNAAGCTMYATEGTAAMISGLGLPVIPIPKRLSVGHPNVVDVIEDGTVQAVVNTVTGDREVLQDGFAIRRARDRGEDTLLHVARHGARGCREHGGLGGRVQREAAA